MSHNTPSDESDVQVSSCPECGFEGEREGDSRNDSIDIFGVVLLSRKYGVLVCPECGFEETI